ncbi:MAG TPA: VirB8/TrbF family protein [Candidatus Angelobacter sp.]|nr:VirB8/TrbF family protein [Candidatus Angelobacter sp.]
MKSNNSNKASVTTLAPTPEPIVQRLPTLPAPPDAELNAAKRLFFEMWGNAVVTNTYLKITNAALCLLCAGCLYIAYATVKKIETFHTRYVRIDSIGRAEAVSYDDLNFKPAENEKSVKYFLGNFCRLYYSRNKFTLRDNFRQSLLFLETPLADSTLSAWSKNQVINNYLGSSDPIQEVKINRIDIEDLRQAPYKATIEFEVNYISPIDGSSLKRIQYTAHFVFGFREVVNNDLIQTNPLGLSIAYFREDEALH